MSTLKANNVSNNSGGAIRSMDDIVGATPRAWVNFNGTGTVAIRASYNVSSITDNGTGDYTVNFTNAMPDANYAVICTCDNTLPASGNGLILGLYQATPLLAASARLSTKQPNAPTTPVDVTYACASFFR